MRDRSSIVLGDDPYYHAAAVKFSPDGKYVATAGTDGTVFFWNVRTKKLVRKWKAHDREVWDVAFMPDGRGLVTGSGDETLNYWDLDQAVSGDFKRGLEFAGHTVRHFPISYCILSCKLNVFHLTSDV
jgi:WD40 repeat protein